MRRWSGFLGVFGLLVLLFGVGGFFVFGVTGVPVFLSTLVVAHLVLGVVLLALWLMSRDWKGGLADSSVGRGARFGANVLLYSVVFLGLVGIANFLVHRHNQRWDLTEEGVYSLSPQSLSIAQNLAKPLKLVAFKGAMQNDQMMEDLFKLYKDGNPAKITTEIVDPQSKPHLVDQYEMKTGNLVYLEYGEGDKKSVSRINEFGEQALTNAILKLTRGEAKKIYFLQGHGEPALDNAAPRGLKQFADAIGDEHLTLEGLLLGEKGAVPDDAAAVLLVSPSKPLLAVEKESLLKYGDGGGSLLLLSDPRRDTDVAEIADHFGIQVNKDLVIDLVQRLFAAPGPADTIIARNYGTHAITRALTNQDPVIFSVASSVKAKSGNAQGATYTELVKSGSNSWAETNLAMVFDQSPPQVAFDEGQDTRGPVSLGVAFEKKVSSESGKPEERKGESEPKFDKTSRVVVVGDSDWLTNQLFAQYANRDLALNVLNWLVGEEGGITIRPKSLKASTTSISRQDYMLIFAASLLVPELILLVGLLVWWKRRTAEQ
jgi:ABC-type uncharacterized transport system involved in gliding motility auxiliary subunit